MPTQHESGVNDSRTLTFAVVSGLPDAGRLLDDMCRALGDALACSVRGRVLPNYGALEQEVRAGGAQIAWAPPLVAAALEDAGHASIALCCTRGGQAGYHAVLFTRHASPIETLADLKGTHAVWVDASSSAGYLFPRHEIVAQGLDPVTLFGRESFLGTHARVACAVLDGEADVGATYALLDPNSGRPLSAGWLEAGAGINAAFVLATAGPIPSDAIVLAKALPEELREALVAAIAALPAKASEALGQLLNADGFAPPPAAHFDSLRERMRNAQRR
ncbi:Phosphonate ABC transporter phosphate-binding periplasmic component [Minicystis rosea]|nr:Phosphonate ABC transporter phosphate-binding periplasmic component [Minicystis rosea]